MTKNVFDQSRGCPGDHHRHLYCREKDLGNDVADLNNDGLVDILAVDMMPADNYRKKMMLPPNNYLTYQNNEKFGYDYQYPRNTLQMNQGVNPKTGKPVFSEIGLLAGVAETDWSWTPMATDFDNDGLRDIIVTNGFPRDITDQDFMIYRAVPPSITWPKNIEFINNLILLSLCGENYRFIFAGMFNIFC